MVPVLLLLVDWIAFERLFCWRGEKLDWGWIVSQHFFFKRNRAPGVWRGIVGGPGRYLSRHIHCFLIFTENQPERWMPDLVRSWVELSSLSLFWKDPTAVHSSYQSFPQEHQARATFLPIHSRCLSNDQIRCWKSPDSWSDSRLEESWLPSTLLWRNVGPQNTALSPQDRNTTVSGLYTIQILILTSYNTSLIPSLSGDEAFCRSECAL